MISKQLKLISAGIGAGAVIGDGRVGRRVPAAHGEGTQTFGEGPEITLGETTTSTTGQTEIPTPVAVPEVTAEPG